MHTERDVWSYGCTLTHTDYCDSCAVTAWSSQREVRGLHQAVDWARQLKTANTIARHRTRS